MQTYSTINLGWCPDVPDFRDRSSPQLHIKAGHYVDLREPRFESSCPEIGHSMHASCAQSIIAMLDWQNKKWKGEGVEASIAFLHGLTVRLVDGGGRQGIGIRSCIKTLVQFGAPPEHLWPSTDQNFTAPCSPELYGFARHFQSLVYFRLDGWMHDSVSRLDAMRGHLFCGNPFLIGFAVPATVFAAEQNLISFDPAIGNTIGGSVAVVMGYDNNFQLPYKIQNRSVDQPNRSKGAFLVRTCWGSRWGDNGFGWLPYAFVDTRFAHDAWAITHTDWV